MKRGDDTRRAILKAGLALARTGLANVTGRSVSAAAGVSHPALCYHFPRTAKLRNAIVDYAFAKGDPDVIARLILDKHPICDTLSRAERAAFLERAAG